MEGEFVEIGHCGGKIWLMFRTSDDGHRSVQLRIEAESKGGPMRWTALYALEQGIPVADLPMPGVGSPWPPPPISACIPVVMACDSEGHFGHLCRACNGYWRSGPAPNLCPYCATYDDSFNFLSQAQSNYVRQYCQVFVDCLNSDDDSARLIDMDAVADSIGKVQEKPPFYVAEESQQRKFTCNKCNEFNDILGRFAYCSLCGERNDLVDFEEQTVPSIRSRLTSGNPPEDCVRDAVAAFDSFVGQIAREFARRVPLTVQRKTRLLRRSFHDLEETREVLEQWFDIDACKGMKDSERKTVAKLFHRRHVYEHKGGEADQKYIDDSGDTSVRLRQRLHEDQETAHSLLGSLVKMVRNIHAGFHELFPLVEAPVVNAADRQARIAQQRFGQ